MSLLNFLTPRNVLSILHIVLGVLIFVAGIMCGVKTRQQTDSDHWGFMTVALLLISGLMIATQCYGHKFFAQTGFMYTFGGRGTFYVFVSCLLWIAYYANHFAGIVAIMALLMGVIKYLISRNEI